MSLRLPSFGSLFLISCLVLLVLPSGAHAFGAGNIPSIAQIEGNNFRHGDIEDMLKTIAFIKGHKWTSMMVKRVYFGNWLRDYSQAVDVGSLKGVQAPTIRILVWVLSFLSFGYATEEFEVTEERLGVYRPEEHIDNPKDYADNEDARKFDPRLRGPVQQIELDIDPQTGMKNYIANEKWRMGNKCWSRKEADLCEALRCLGQGLHCMEDFGAHTNYCELALRELGYREVFPHVGAASEINVRGHHIFPLVTGTFGAVDFLHSVLGEATDHFTQTEVEEMDLALLNAEKAQGGAGGKQSSGLQFANLLSQIPGIGGDFANQARDLQAQSAAQEYENASNRANANVNTQFQGPPGSSTGPPGPGIPGMSGNMDPVQVAKKIYPILEFRDRIVKAISATIAKIPGLESLVEKISETLTVFVLSLLAPFVRPIIDAVSKSLKEGSSTVVEASAHQQFEVWSDPHSTNPTHSMLSKDHFSNKLNGVAGRVATTILQYVTPRILYAWQNPGVPVEEVMRDILRVFHHPALRDENVEVHRNMFNTVRKWVDEQPDRHNLNNILSSASVKAGHNHKTSGEKSGSRGIEGHTHDHGALGGHGKTSGSIWAEIKSRDLGSMGGADGNPAMSYMQASSPQPGSPAAPPLSPNFGYANVGHNSRPTSSQGGYLSAAPPQGSYQQSSIPGSYQQEYGSSYQQQQPYGQQGGYQQGFGQPPYGGPPQGPPGSYGQQQYPPGPPQPPYGGFPPQGPPPSGWQGGPPPPNQYPSQGYPGQQQYPPYPDQRYGGGGY